MTQALCYKTIHELQELLKKRQTSAREILESVYARIDAVEPRINAYITLSRQEAFKQADMADRAISQNRQQPLTGIPVSLKDLICTKGIKTTCASKMLENFLPPFDATVVEKLKHQGAVLTGKTNMDEFAMGSSCETSFFGVTKNPWDLSRVPGGSSGGSAAAVAADACIASLASDTGGSIRQPASYCGVVGMKPTYGRVSRFGLIAFASSLDQIGVVAKDVQDAAILLNGISGFDSNDSTSVNMSVPDFTQVLAAGVNGFTIGVPREYFMNGVEREVEHRVWQALRALEKKGARLTEISLAHTDYAVAAYYLIATAEASSNLARYDGANFGFRSAAARDLKQMYEMTRSEGFGEEVKRRAMLGTYGLSAGYYDAYYRKASQVRTLIRQDFEESFKQCDLIITPTSPNPAFKLGEKLTDPLSMYLSDVFTIPVNLAGIPAISIPCGLSKEKLPLGVQIIGNFFEEEKIFKAAYCCEQALGVNTVKPPI